MLALLPTCGAYVLPTGTHTAVQRHGTAVMQHRGTPIDSWSTVATYQPTQGDNAGERATQRLQKSTIVRV